MSYVVLGVIEAGMDTNDEVRRRRLERLCMENGGLMAGLTAVAKRAGVSRASLDQILKRVLLPAKSGGERSTRSLGDLAARKIEVAYDLAPGWLDWPFEAVRYESYIALTDLDRGVVQARMMAAIEDRLASHAYGLTVKPDRAGRPDGKELHTDTTKEHNERTEPVFGDVLTEFFNSGRGEKNGRSVDDAASAKSAAPTKKQSGSRS